MRCSRVSATFTALLVGIVASLPAQQMFTPDSATLAPFRWRNIGPANTMGRVSDVVGIPSPSVTFFVAAAGGGIWKTTNNGVTFRPVFDDQKVVAMGMLAIAPSDTLQVWAGTGEPNSRNTIAPGGGIYKSTDGGIHWKLMGLEKTQVIGRIVVHPTNPNIVWVAALGAPWNPSPDRGLYKTTDGGQTWRLVKFISNKAGFVDVAIDPTNPDILFAASYERQRGPYYLQSGGPGSALWRSTDGGETWTEVKGGGFPEAMKGRIGLAIAPSDYRVMYAMVEADTAPNPKGKAGTGKAQVSPSGLYRSADAGKTWTRTSTANTRPFYYSQVRVDSKNPDRVYWSSTPVMVSNDGGKTTGTTTNSVHVDHHAMWIDPNDPNRIIVGDDGGVSITFDKGGNWLVLNSLPISQLYAVSFDYAFPYNVCGGLQDNGSWCGPSRRKSGPISNAMWYTVAGGDGFWTAQDPTDPRIVYAESQGGSMSRINVATDENRNLSKPNARARLAEMEDSVAVIELDAARAASTAGKKRMAELKATIAADSAAFALRWNWETPFFLSPHNPRTFYAGGNRVMKSVDRGDNMFPISPDLSYNDTMKTRISTRTTGGITNDATGAETYGTVVALAESYVRPGLLYAGTDDGRVWLTRNDGANWDELTKRFPFPDTSHVYVSRIEPSYADTNTFYVTFDNHRNGDYAPYVFVTTDYGKSFRSITSNLPTGGVDYVHVIREDPANPDVLYLGSDVGAYVSFNRGGSWQRFMSGLPTVAVYDLKVHPRDRELIAATHGRGIWIVDVNAVSQLSGVSVAAGLTVFKPKTAFEYGEPIFEGQSTGQGVYFRGQSAPYGAQIEYLVTGGGTGQASIVIQDAMGDTVQALTGPMSNGLQRVNWTFNRRAAPVAPTPLSPSQLRDSIVAAKRMETVFDSLRKAGSDTAALGRIRALLARQQPGGGRAGGFGGGGGRGRGSSDVWVERPGESFGAGGRGGGGGGGRGARGGAALAASAGADSTLAQTISDLLQVPGGGRGGRGGGGGGRGGAGSADAGDYLVTVKVGDKVARTLLRVERVNGFGGDSFGFGGDEDEVSNDDGLNGLWDPFTLSSRGAPKASGEMTLGSAMANLSSSNRGARQTVRSRLF